MILTLIVERLKQGLLINILTTLKIYILKYVDYEFPFHFSMYVIVMEKSRYFIYVLKIKHIFVKIYRFVN